jgi:hypothetical protein
MPGAVRQRGRPRRTPRDTGAMRRLVLRIVLIGTAGVLVGLVASVGPTARADCVAPSFTHDAQTIGRGETIVVTGMFWGTECYDTGPPPEGQGALGEPATDVEVYVVQGDVEVLVARGRAASDYTFEVEVPVPTELEPGPATVAVRSTGFEGTDGTGSFDLTAAPAVEPTISTPVEFGPSTGATTPTPATPPTTTGSTTRPSTATAVTDPDDTDADDAGGTGSAGALVVGGLTVLGAAAAAGWIIARRRAPPA